MSVADKVFSDFRKGELDSFYRTMYPGLILYALKWLGDEKELLAEDFVQEAVFKAWQRRTSFGSAALFGSFLYTSIKNDIISLHRKDSAKHRYIAQLEDKTLFPNTIIDQEAQTILYDAIGQLPQPMKQIFEMSLIDGLRTADIAGQLQLSDSSVLKYRSRALDILRQKLSPNLFSFLFSGIL